MSALQLDAENPWPGLESFDEASAAFFHGRSAEAEELFRALNRAPLTVLYSQSGLGKTSLLRAGLFPLLREADYLPVYIRLDHSDGTPALLEQVQQILIAAAQEARCDLPPPAAGESLWAYFHRRDLEIWSRGNRPLTPVLVFDQFEELFTLGRRAMARGGEIQALLAALACLAENRAPAELAQALETEPDLAQRFDFRKQDYKLLLAFREDYLPEIEDLRRLIPSIAQNRLRLLPLSQPQALEVVEQSGSALLTHEVALRIVRFVADAQQSQDGEETANVLIASDAAVEPALLSLVCAGLNTHRKQQGLAGITAELLDSCQTAIIENFYAQSLAGLNPAVRVFIEDELLTRAGHRDSRVLDDALAVPGITQDAIDQLVSHRLLRVEERYGQKRLELIHDRLTDTVRQSRDRRQGEEAAAAAQRKARQRRKRLVTGIIAVASVIVLLAVFAGYSYLQWQRAEEQTRRAEQRKQAMLDAISRLTYEVPERLLQRPGLAQLARDIFEANVKLLEELMEQEGNTPDVLREKGANYSFIGDLRMQFGDLAGAMQAYRTYLEIAERLAAQTPSNSEWQRDLSVSHNKIGDVLLRQGDLAGAMQAYRTFLEIAERLAEQDSSNSFWQRDLSFGHERVGDVLSAQGDLAGALKEYRADLEIVESLAAQDPGNSEWQHDLGISHERTGNVLLAQGNLSGARTEYQTRHAIIERLASQDPGNSGWQRDLSVSHEKVGNVLLQQGDLAVALNEYRASLEIRERLAAQDPGNSVWQRDLSVSYRKVGDVLLQQGDPAGALKEYRAGMEIHERLAAQDPSNSQWQRDVAVSVLNIGTVLEKQDKKSQARESYLKARQIIVRLREQSPDWAQLRSDLEWLDQRLEALK